MRVARGYHHEAPVEQLAVKKLSDSRGEFGFPSGHRLEFNYPFKGCQLHARYSEFHYYFSKDGYRGVSVKVNPSRDQVFTVRLAKYESEQSSEVETHAEDFAWTSFMKFNSTSLQVVSGLPAAVTVGAVAIPVAVVVWPIFAIGDLF